jgi:DNA-binding XRE family transcriptional regulator
MHVGGIRRRAQACPILGCLARGSGPALPLDLEASQIRGSERGDDDAVRALGQHLVMRRWEWVEDNRGAEQMGLRTIGQAVLRGRLSSHLTQVQLGYRVGLNQSTISRLETGRLRTMRMVTLARIIGVLKRGPDFAFPGEPDPATRHLPDRRAP